MPTYYKFLEDILTKKRTLGDQQIMAMEKECSSLLLNKMPHKLGDPMSFSIPCVVGGVPISRALFDLGASVSVLPLKVTKKIGICDLIPTNMTLQLADRPVKHPLGVLEDVPVKVGKCLIPADFIVLDILEDSHTPIILGRPFLAIGGVLIDVRDGRLTFRIEGDKVEFNLPNMVKGPQFNQACTVEVIEEVVEAVVKEESEIEEAFQISLHDEEMKEDHEVNDELLKKVERLLPPKVLKTHKASLGYSIDGIKGLSPNLCMHLINLEEGSRPSVEGQRRLNPKMAEVVKNEVLKLLESGIIYEITDSKWVSPVHVVTKKGGVTMVEQSDGTCVPTRPVTRWHFAVGAVLGQVVDKKRHVIYYSSKTLDQAQCNYSTTEKEMVAIVHAIEKFRQYLVGSKVVVYTNHTALRQLMVKKDAKPRLLRRVLLLQEFDLEIRDKAEAKIVVVDHLSRLAVEDHGIIDKSGLIDEWLREDALMEVSVKVPWRCVSKEEGLEIVDRLHNAAYGGHLFTSRTIAKVLQDGFYCPSMFKDIHMVVKSCDSCQRTGNIRKQNEMSLTNIWKSSFSMAGYRFYGPFFQTLAEMSTF
ncbi:uncharacterized protein LOC141651416 [Silene latifolia]|uniref:uncharacterized protein LOC141651416 n=1 Tax=Silene latifolia TaxID=37657 RepID=UPI003D77BEBB